MITTRIIYVMLLLVGFLSECLLKINTHPLVLVDVGHDQRFWQDPKMMKKDDRQLKRLKYMTNELSKTISKFNGQIKYVNDEIELKKLKKVDILFIHVPSAKYSKKEVRSIQKYVKNGGNLFLVMDVDYWSSLEQTNVNEIIKDFDIHYEGKIPDSLSGGYTIKGTITKEPLKIPYHGGRIVKGGTPFCYGHQTKEFSFGVYKEVKKGKVVVMGDGMVSLYMTNWKDVNDYQCQEFIQAVFKWMLN